MTADALVSVVIAWLVAAAALILLIVALIALLRAERAARAERRQARRDNRELTGDLDAADDRIRQQADEIDALNRRWRSYGAELTRLQHERDQARGALRDVLNAREAGFRYPRPRPMPMPPDVDDALTEEFTKIVERNNWPGPPS